jgi:hypothetical protein
MAKQPAAQSPARRPSFNINPPEYPTAQVMPDSIAPPKTLAPYRRNFQISIAHLSGTRVRSSGIFRRLPASEALHGNGTRSSRQVRARRPKLPRLVTGSLMKSAAEFLLSQ